MAIGYTIRKLKGLRDAVLADGVVDWDETTELLAAARGLAVRHGFPFEDFERQLLKCREDGEITPEESKRLALQLDYLSTFYSNMRLKFWMLVVVMLSFAVSAVAVCASLVRTAGHAVDATLAPEPSEPGVEFSGGL